MRRKEKGGIGLGLVVAAAAVVVEESEEQCVVAVRARCSTMIPSEESLSRTSI